jgi:exosome complex component RRP45
MFAHHHGSNYVAIRDDAGLKSLSANERDFLRSCALSERVLREDGRTSNQPRKVRMQLGRWDNGAEVTVQWGVGTRVTALMSAEIVPPSPDRPSEGMLNFSVEVSPMASSSFRQAPAASTAQQMGSRGPNFSDIHQRLLSNRILRCLEKIILVGGALDTEALVLLPNQWVWRLTVALTVLDDGGNLLDACVMAAVAALRHYRKPHVDLSELQDSSQKMLPTMIPSIVKEATPLPLHHTPLSISFALIPADDAVLSASSTSIVAALIDPSDREELVQNGSLTIAMNIHSEVCLLDYGGGCELTPTKLKECWTLADSSIKQLCELLEGALKDADEQAQADRLARLQQQREGTGFVLPPKVANENSPYFQQTDTENGFMEIEADATTTDADQIQQAQSDAEEAYRQQALDYSRGHVASAVKENNDGGKSSAVRQAGSLLASMLKSVQGGNPSIPEEKADPPGNGEIIKMQTKPKETKIAEKKPELAMEKPKEIPTTTAPSKKEIPVAPMDVDSDEEEVSTTVLTSEFDSVPAQKPAPKLEPVAAEAVNEDDISDLSMAIKKKKKTTKSKKK